MATKPIPKVNKEQFNYQAFERDLRSACAERQSSLAQLSVNRFFRSDTFLTQGLKNGSLTLPIINSLADYMGTDLKKYEIRPEPETVTAPEKPVEAEDPEEPAGKGWSCQIRVDEEFGTVMMKVMKDGQEIALGRSYLYGRDDTGVMQSISYAAHMCYKLTQQSKIKATGEQTETVRKPVPEAPFIQLPFRDWIQKYASENSTYGALARFISDCGKDFPESDEKRMRTYLTFHNGGVHQKTFQSAYSMYTTWCRAGKSRSVI